MARTTALLVLFAQALPSNAWSNLRPSRALSPSSTVRMAQDDVGRRETLTTGLAGIGALFVSSSFATPALALPILTAKGSAVADPKKAELDQDLLGSGDVQKSLKLLKTDQAVVRKLRAGLEANMQADFAPVIKKELSFSDLRSALNKVNEVVEDDDTQRGVDRLTRTIIQDVIELETSSKVKDGKERSEKKAAAMQVKLVKLDESFREYLSFFP